MSVDATVERLRRGRSAEELLELIVESCETSHIEIRRQYINSLGGVSPAWADADDLLQRARLLLLHVEKRRKS